MNGNNALFVWPRYNMNMWNYDTSFAFISVKERKELNEQTPSLMGSCLFQCLTLNNFTMIFSRFE